MFPNKTQTGATGSNRLNVYNSKFDSNYVKYNAGNDDIWLWQTDMLTIVENNDTSSINEPTNPPTTMKTHDDDDSNDTNNTDDNSDDSGSGHTHGDSGEPGGNGHESGESSTSIMSILEDLSELEWIIIGASVAFVCIVCCCVCLIRYKVKKNGIGNNSADIEFKLLDNDGNNTQNHAIGMDRH